MSYAQQGLEERNLLTRLLNLLAETVPQEIESAVESIYFNPQEKQVLHELREEYQF